MAGSTSSQESRNLSILSLDILSDEELVKLVNDLKLEIKLINLENEILQNTITRLDPKLMRGVPQALEYAMKLQATPTFGITSSVKMSTARFAQAELFSSPSRMVKSCSRVNTRRVESSGRVSSVIFGTGPKINLNERLELVSSAIKHEATDLEKCIAKGKKDRALYTAQIEVDDNRIKDIKNARRLFQQEVLVNGWDKIAQRIPAEVWVRFMAEWVKKEDHQIGRLRLRTSTLNIQYRKLKELCQNKAELSEHLTPVDFDKIKIKNSECVQLLDTQLIHLEKLKAMTGDANLTLTIHKKTLMSQNEYLTKVKKMANRRLMQTAHLKNKSAIIRSHTDMLTEQVNEFRNLRMTYHVPQIVDYFNVKEEIYQLNRANRGLEKKLETIRRARILHGKETKVTNKV